MAIRQIPRLVLLAACASGTPLALAHADEGAAPADTWVFVGLLLAAGLYTAGSALLWRSAHRGAGVSEGRAACYFAGIAVLGGALAAPLDALGARLFSVHMVQHEMLMLGAAPLLVAGRPLPVFLWAFPARARLRIGAFVRMASMQGAWRALVRPFCAWSLHAVVLWAWHIPRLFQAGLESGTMHAWQHASFLASALLFWSSLSGTAARGGHGTVVLSLFTTAIHTGILGALLTFSSHAWYSVYAGKAVAWGLTPLEDQQLGGLIMWVPAGFLFVLAGVFAAARALCPDRERPA